MPDAILTSQQARAVDRVAIEQYGIPGIILMENAGRGCVEQLCTLGGCGPAAIFCGQGNNGGDGFVIARHLKVRGFDPSVYLIGAENRLSNDSQINYRSLRACGIPIETITQSHEVSALVPVWQRCSWLIDALLGTGASGPPREPMSTLIEAVNHLPVKRLAVDIPTGLDADTGEVSPVAFRADHTCTFVAAKPGLLVETAAAFVGEVHVVDIGVPLEIIQQVTSQEGLQSR